MTAYHGPRLFADLEDVMAALKERSRALGADALVGVRVVNRGGESAREGYSGTAVRFEDERCMH